MSDNGRAQDRKNKQRAPLPERVFLSTNRTQCDDRKTRIFNSSSSLDRIMVRKRKPIREEEFEEDGWIILR